jgi:hypothetical protein
MKRISVFTVTVLMLSPSITNAITYRIPRYFRIRYSPYAFSSKNPSGLISSELKYSSYALSRKNPSGLIPRYLRYSPYALSSKNPSGLVPFYFRYSPYALSSKNPSGLISDYYSFYFLPYDYPFYFRGCKASNPGDCGANCCTNACSNKSLSRSNDTRHYYEQTSSIQRERTRMAAEYAKKKSILREKDGMQIICSYLKSNSIDDFQIDRLFKVENKTVSVNFVFRDKNIIIKYWNPEETRSLSQESGYRKTYFEKYLKQWNELCQAHEEKGGEIYLIESADKEEILSKLSLCRELTEG